ncbi:MAG TPA: alpha/beta hydrolase [Xanthomonadales bacterium]|nr:alpha/beta hydrolase [Xanthomonadales bacterium]
MNYLLSFRMQKTGGAVVPGQLLVGAGLGTLDDIALEPQLTFLVHGFNVNRPEGEAALLQLADMLTSSRIGGRVAVLWPGDHWTGPLSYSFEGKDADDTAIELTDWINDHAPEVGINFIAHSLGSRVVLETISRLNGTNRTVPQVCLMAAAVDDDCLSDPAVYLQTGNKIGRLASLSSKKDYVLRFTYPAGDLLQAFLFADDASGLALGYHGARKHQKSKTLVPDNLFDARIPKARKAGHGDYLPDSQPNNEQQSAARFADQVIDGVGTPAYV